MPEPLKIHVPALPRRTRVGLYLSLVLLVSTTSGVIFGWPILQSNAENGGWAVSRYMQSALLVALLSYSGGGFLATVFVVRPLLQRLGLLRTFWIYHGVFLVGGFLITLSLRLSAELVFPGVVLLGVGASCLLNFYYELTPYIEHCNAIITVAYSLSTSVFQLTTIPMPPEAGLAIWLVLAGVFGELFYCCFRPYFQHLEDRFEAVNEGELRLLDAEADLDRELVSEDVGETIEDQNGGPPVLTGAPDRIPYLLQIQEYCGSIKNLFRSAECWMAGLIVLAIITNQSYFYGTFYQRSGFFTDKERAMLDALLTVAQVCGSAAGLIVLLNVHYAIVILCTLFLIFSLCMPFELPIWALVLSFFCMTIGSTGAMTCCMALSFKYAHTLSAEAFCYFGMILGNAAGPTFSFFFKGFGCWSDIVCSTMGVLALAFSCGLLASHLVRRARTAKATREADQAVVDLEDDDLPCMYPYDSHHMSGELHLGLGEEDGLEISEISAIQAVRPGDGAGVGAGTGAGVEAGLGGMLGVPGAQGARGAPGGSKAGARAGPKAGPGSARRPASPASDQVPPTPAALGGPGAFGANPGPPPGPKGKRGIRSLQDEYAAALSSDSRPTDSIPQDIFSWESQISPESSHRSTSSADLEEVNRVADIMWTQRLARRRPRKPMQDRFTEDGLPVALADMIRRAPPLELPRDGSGAVAGAGAAADPDGEGALATIPVGSDEELMRPARVPAGGHPGGNLDGALAGVLGGPLGARASHPADASQAGDRASGTLDGVQLDGVIDSPADSEDGFSAVARPFGAPFHAAPTPSALQAAQGARQLDELSSSSATPSRGAKAHGSSRAQRKGKAEEARMAAAGLRRRTIDGMPGTEGAVEPGAAPGLPGAGPPGLADEGLSSDVAAILGGASKKRGRGPK